MKTRKSAASQQVMEGPVLSSELPFANFSVTATIVGYCMYSVVLASSIQLFFHLTGGADPLAIPLLRSGPISIDLWSFVHVINFAVVGIVFPSRFLGMTLYGVFWVSTAQNV